MKNSLLLLGTAPGSGTLLWKLQSRKEPISLVAKVDVITGAASGIGRETAHRFAAEGSTVVLVDLHPD